MAYDPSQPLVGAMGGGPADAAAQSAKPAIHFMPGGPVIGGVSDGKGGWTGGMGPLTPDAFKSELQKMGLSGQDLDGLLRVSQSGTAGFDWQQGKGFTSTGTGQPAQPPALSGAAPTGGGLTAQPGMPGGGGFGGGGGGFGGPSSPAGRNVAPGGGFMGPTGNSSPGSTSASGSLALGGAAGGGGMAWNTPLGFKNPGPGPGANPTVGGSGAGFTYGQPKSIFDGLPSNPTFGDVVGQVMRRQEDNRNAALGVLSNARGEIINDPNRQLLNSRTSDLLSNPYSMDEATISRILGQTNQGITQRAAEMTGNARDRAAAGGVLRSGGANAAQDAIANNASGQMADAERSTRIQAAIQNQQDLRSAMGAALPGIAENTQARNSLDKTAAVDVLGGSSYSGDAFLSNMMAGKQGGTLVNPLNPGYDLNGGPVLRL